MTSVEIQCLTIPTLYLFLDKESLLNLNLCCSKLLESMNYGVIPPHILLNLNKVSDKVDLLRSYSGYMVLNQVKLSTLVKNRVKYPVIKHLHLKTIKQNDQRPIMALSFLQLTYLHLSQIHDEIEFKAECPNLKKIIVDNCYFTLIQVDASPSEVQLSYCEYLKEFKTKQTEYQKLKIYNCTKLLQSFVNDTLSFPHLNYLHLSNIYDKIHFKAECPDLKKFIVDNCDFTLIEVDASPTEVELSNCHFLKEFKAKQTKYKILDIFHCTKLSLSNWFVNDTLSFPQLTYLHLSNIYDEIEFKAECPNLKKFIINDCYFTSLEVDASPSEVELIDCEYLKEFKTKQTEYKILKITHCIELLQSFVNDTLSFPQLTYLHLSNIYDEIEFKAECPNLNKFIINDCYFTSIEVDASPSEVELIDCEYLKEFKTKQTEYQILYIYGCPNLPMI